MCGKGGIGNPLPETPDVARQSRSHRRSPLLPATILPSDPKRTPTPTEIIAVPDEVRCGVVDLDVLGEAIVLRCFREFWCRSVPLCRSTNDVLTVVLARDRHREAPSRSIVPKTSVRTTSTTRPFARALRTVA